MNLVLIGLAFLALAALEFPPLWRRGKRGELITAGLIWLAALVYSGLQAMRLLE